jgi:catechol 2,3-dioxygenase-like lactoylglutathione lyase family enzyme
MRARCVRLLAFILIACGAIAVTVHTATRGNSGAPLRVSRVDTVGFTVSDMNRALDFYTRVLPFMKQSDLEIEGRPYELLSGVAGARARVVRLALGDEQIELTEYRSAHGRPFPEDFRANDRGFQHIAMIVRDMDLAYARLRANGVERASTAPQRLPDWNPNAGGIRAFYFRDPDRHYLEILQFPDGRGLSKWHAPGGELFLGIDHTAIVVDNTDASLAYYHDTLGFTVAGASENYDIEQEHLNNVHGARLRITALRAAQGPGIELLEYLAPRDGHSTPTDLHANDIAHWQTTVVTATLDSLLPLARAHKVALVSPGPVSLAGSSLGFTTGALTRDPDGHGIRFVTREPTETNSANGNRTNDSAK